MGKKSRYVVQQLQAMQGQGLLPTTLKTLATTTSATQDVDLPQNVQVAFETTTSAVEDDVHGTLTPETTACDADVSLPDEQMPTSEEDTETTAPAVEVETPPEENEAAAVAAAATAAAATAAATAPTNDNDENAINEEKDATTVDTTTVDTTNVDATIVDPPHKKLRTFPRHTKLSFLCWIRSRMSPISWTTCPW